MTKGLNKPTLTLHVQTATNRERTIDQPLGSGNSSDSHKNITEKVSKHLKNDNTNTNKKHTTQVITWEPMRDVAAPTLAVPQEMLESKRVGLRSCL